MPMLKDIAVFFNSSKVGIQVLRAAAKLAAAHEAQLIGLTTIEHAVGFPENCFARGQAISEVIQHQQRIRTERIQEIQESLSCVAAEFGVITELRLVAASESDSEALARCIYCDLIVLGHPLLPGAPHGMDVSQVLYRIGVPMLIVPASWNGEGIGTRVTVTWNGSRQARRAIADALPILVAAQRVQLLIIDSPTGASLQEAAAGDALAAYLIRHGVTVELRRVVSRGSIANAIVNEAMDSNADLIVFGAYSRPRIAEAILDGVSRTLLTDVPMPLLTTH